MTHANPGARWLAIGLALLAACASARDGQGRPSDRERYWYYAKGDVTSFMTHGRIAGWKPLGRNELVIWTRFDKAYILRVDPSCFELDSAMGIQLDSRMSSTVGTGDAVLVGRQRCQIRRITEIDYKLMKQEERELSEDRRKQKEKEKAEAEAAATAKKEESP